MINRSCSGHLRLHIIHIAFFFHTIHGLNLFLIFCLSLFACLSFLSFSCSHLSSHPQLSVVDISLASFTDAIDFQVQRYVLILAAGGVPQEPPLAPTPLSNRFVIICFRRGHWQALDQPHLLTCSRVAILTLLSCLRWCKRLLLGRSNGILTFLRNESRWALTSESKSSPKWVKICGGLPVWQVLSTPPRPSLYVYHNSLDQWWYRGFPDSRSTRSSDRRLNSLEQLLRWFLVWSVKIRRSILPVDWEVGEVVAARGTPLTVWFTQESGSSVVKATYGGLSIRG